MTTRAANPTFPIRSSQSNNSFKPLTEKYWTLKDLHDKLFKLYSGKDASFTSLTCVSCANLAYFPSECLNCHRLTCRDCREATPEYPHGRHACISCSGELGNENDLHFIVANMLNSAVFRCPYGCDETQIPLAKLEQHI